MLVEHPSRSAGVFSFCGSGLHDAQRPGTVDAVNVLSTLDKYLSDVDRVGLVELLRPEFTAVAEALSAGADPLSFDDELVAAVVAAADSTTREHIVRCDSRDLVAAVAARRPPSDRPSSDRPPAAEMVRRCRARQLSPSGFGKWVRSLATPDERAIAWEALADCGILSAGEDRTVWLEVMLRLHLEGLSDGRGAVELLGFARSSDEMSRAWRNVVNTLALPLSRAVIETALELDTLSGLVPMLVRRTPAARPSAVLTGDAAALAAEVASGRRTPGGLRADAARQAALTLAVAAGVVPARSASFGANRWRQVVVLCSADVLAEVVQCADLSAAYDEIKARSAEIAGMSFAVRAAAASKMPARIVLNWVTADMFGDDERPQLYRTLGERDDGVRMLVQMVSFALASTSATWVADEVCWTSPALTAPILSDHVEALVVRHAVQRLAETIGPDSRRWATLLALAEHWSGSLSELADTVVNVDADHPQPSTVIDLACMESCDG